MLICDDLSAAGPRFRRKCPALDPLSRFQVPLRLAMTRDASFAKPWFYVAIMFAVGGVYLAFVLATRGAKSLKMPDLLAIDAILDADKGAEVSR
jgi:hypothetical protein